MDNLKPSLEEQYFDEITQNEVLLLKAKPSSTVKKVIYDSLTGVTLYIVLAFYLIFFQLSDFIDDCGMIDSMSVNLLISRELGVAMCLFWATFFLKTLNEVRWGKKTGWDGNPNKTVYEDTILFKYTPETHIDKIVGLCFRGMLVIFFFTGNLNWTAINQSSSFAEANDYAHQQCMAEKVERKNRKAEK